MNVLKLHDRFYWLQIGYLNQFQFVINDKSTTLLQNNFSCREIKKKKKTEYHSCFIKINNSIQYNVTNIQKELLYIKFCLSSFRIHYIWIQNRFFSQIQSAFIYYEVSHQPLIIFFLGNIKVQNYIILKWNFLRNKIYYI